MNKFLKYMLYTATLFAIAFGVGVISYRLSDFTMDSTKTSAINSTLEVDKDKEVSVSSSKVKNASNNVPKELNKDVTVLSKNAKFSFESAYEDKDSEVKIIDVPTIFVGADKDTVAMSFLEWDIVSFTENSVYFKRTIETPEPIYVLTSENDQLVVIYKDSDGNITVEEETGIYIGTLPESDIEKIKKGIVYKNKTDVLKALQNYDS